MTPDPYKASGGPATPQSWNKYAYVQGDVVNFTDHGGLWIDPCGVPGDCCDPDEDPWCDGGGEGGWGGGGGGGAAPLTCTFTGPVFGSGYWVAINGVQTWIVPINLLYQAAGGNGTYTWTETQQFIDLYVDLVQGRPPTIEPSSGTDKPLQNFNSGSTAIYSDGPGLGVGTSANFVAYSIKIFFTDVSVTSAGQTLPCPAVEWEQFITLRQTNKQEYPYGKDWVVQVF